MKARMLYFGIIIIFAFHTNAQSQESNDSATNQIKIQRISNVNLPQIPSKLFIEGDYCYITDADSGLQIVDISDINHPKITGKLDNLGIVIGIYVKNKIAYLASADSGLQIIDITDNNNPSKMPNMLFLEMNSLQDIKIAGNYAYVVDEAYLYIINIENPVKPAIISKYYPLGYSTSIALKDNYAFSLDCHYREEYCTLEILSIKNLAKPVEVAKYDSLNPWDRLIINQNTLYVAGFNDGLKILDVSNPIKPKLLSSIGAIDSPTDFFVADSLVFITETGSEYGRIQIIDIKNLNYPKSVANFAMENMPRAIWVSNRIIYALVEKDGLVILKY